MKHLVSLEIGKLRFYVGWFSGEDFKLFAIELLNFYEFGVNIFEIQIAKFMLTISYSLFPTK